MNMMQVVKKRTENLGFKGLGLSFFDFLCDTRHNQKCLERNKCQTLALSDWTVSYCVIQGK